MQYKNGSTCLLHIGHAKYIAHHEQIVGQHQANVTVIIVCSDGIQFSIVPWDSATAAEATAPSSSTAKSKTVGFLFFFILNIWIL